MSFGHITPAYVADMEYPSRTPGSHGRRDGPRPEPAERTTRRAGSRRRPPSIDGLVQPASRFALRRSRTLRVGHFFHNGLATIEGRFSFNNSRCPNSSLPFRR